MENRASLLADCISYNSVSHSFHLGHSLAIPTTVELQRIHECILLINITSTGNNQAMFRMMSETYLFAWQYLSNVWNIVFCHLDILCDITRLFAEK